MRWNPLLTVQVRTTKFHEEMIGRKLHKFQGSKHVSSEHRSHSVGKKNRDRQEFLPGEEKASGRHTSEHRAVQTRKGHDKSHQHMQRFIRANNRKTNYLVFKWVRDFDNSQRHTCEWTVSS